MIVPSILYLPRTRALTQRPGVTDGPFGIRIKDHPNGTVVTSVRESANPRRANHAFSSIPF